MTRSKPAALKASSSIAHEFDDIWMQTGGAVKSMRTRIRFLIKPTSCRGCTVDREVAALTLLGSGLID